MDQSESLSEGPLSQPEVKTVDDAIQKKVYKSHKTSIVIIPPEDCWKQIQDIRRFLFTFIALYLNNYNYHCVLTFYIENSWF